MKYVNVRRGFLGPRLERLDVVIFWMPAARGDQLIVLQRFEILLWDQTEQLANRRSLAGQQQRDRSLRLYVMVQMLAPKSSVKVSPSAIVKVAP